MFTPILFIADKQAYTQATLANKEKMLGQYFDPEEIDIAELTKRSKNLNYIDVSEGDFEADEILDIIQENPFLELEDPNATVTTLKVNRERFFDHYIHTIDRYASLLMKRSTTKQYAYGHLTGQTDDDNATIKAYYQLMEEFFTPGNTQIMFMLHSPNAPKYLALHELMLESGKDEYIIDLEHITDFYDATLYY